MTEKLYHADSMMQTFDAQVVSCAPINHTDTYAVVLNRTAFYPEGGGQAFDTGTLGGARVSAVHEQNDVILHTVSSPLAVGTTVQGTIDWPQRFARMQNHSGEHIVSGIVNSRHGLDNAGFHMGRDVMTIDFSGVLDSAALADIERRANDAVYANLPLQTHTPSPAKLADMPYRSKKALSGNVRIVSIDGIDACACCGTHVTHTGAIGLIKLLGAERHKGGTRVELLCGADAYADYCRKHEGTLAVSRLLSAKPSETPQAVQALLDTERRLTEQLVNLRRRIVSLLAAQTEIHNDTAIVFTESQFLEADDARRLCTQLSERAKAALVCTGSDETGYRYMLISANATELAGKLNTQFNGRGGGKPPMAQGQLHGTRAVIEAFWLGLH